MSGEPVSGGGDRPRLFLLRRAWLAWTVAGVVAAAGAVGAGWMFRERTAAADELAGVRAEIAAATARAESLSKEYTPLRDANAERRGELERCLHGLERRVEVYNEMVEETDALPTFLTSEQAARVLERLTEMQDEFQADLRECRDAAANP